MTATIFDRIKDRIDTVRRLRNIIQYCRNELDRKDKSIDFLRARNAELIDANRRMRSDIETYALRFRYMDAYCLEAAKDRGRQHEQIERV